MSSQGRDGPVTVEDVQEADGNQGDEGVEILVKRNRLVQGIEGRSFRVLLPDQITTRLGIGDGEIITVVMDNDKGGPTFVSRARKRKVRGNVVDRNVRIYQGNGREMEVWTKVGNTSYPDSCWPISEVDLCSPASPKLLFAGTSGIDMHVFRQGSI